MQNCSMATSFVTWAESLSTRKDRIWVKTYFFFFLCFWSSRNFGPKTGLILSEDLFFGLHLILGKKRTDCEWRNFFFDLHYFQISWPPSPPFRKSCVRYCICPLLLSSSQHLPQTAYDLGNLGEVVAWRIARYMYSFWLMETHATLNIFCE